MDVEKIIDALRKSRKYIRTVEAYRSTSFLEDGGDDDLGITIRQYTKGDEIKSIDDALAEFGVTP